MKPELTATIFNLYTTVLQDMASILLGITAELASYFTMSHVYKMLRIKHSTYPSRRIAFVMSSTFFLVSTKIIILFPLSTPSSLRSFDNLG
jgi:hypothetical protein